MFDKEWKKIKHLYYIRQDPEGHVIGDLRFPSVEIIITVGENGELQRCKCRFCEQYFGQCRHEMFLHAYLLFNGDKRRPPGIFHLSLWDIRWHLLRSPESINRGEQGDILLRNGSTDEAVPMLLPIQTEPSQEEDTEWNDAAVANVKELRAERAQKAIQKPAGHKELLEMFNASLEVASKTGTTDILMGRMVLFTQAMQKNESVPNSNQQQESEAGQKATTDYRTLTSQKRAAAPTHMTTVTRPKKKRLMSRREQAIQKSHPRHNSTHTPLFSRKEPPEAPSPSVAAVDMQDDFPSNSQDPSSPETDLASPSPLNTDTTPPLLYQNKRKVSIAPATAQKARPPVQAPKKRYSLKTKCSFCGSIAHDLRKCYHLKGLGKRIGGKNQGNLEVRHLIHAILNRLKIATKDGYGLETEHSERQRHEIPAEGRVFVVRDARYHPEGDPMVLLVVKEKGGRIIVPTEEEYDHPNGYTGWDNGHYVRTSWFLKYLREKVWTGSYSLFCDFFPDNTDLPMLKETRGFKRTRRDEEDREEDRELQRYTQELEEELKQTRRDRVFKNSDCEEGDSNDVLSI